MAALTPNATFSTALLVSPTKDAAKTSSATATPATWTPFNLGGATSTGAATAARATQVPSATSGQIWPRDRTVLEDKMEVRDEGTLLTKRSTINFVGPGVTATDDSANSRTVVTIPGAPAAPARSTATITTASLAAGATATGTVDLGKGYRLYSILTSASARTRLYTTPEKRTADASRPSGTDPTGDHGVMLDFTSVDGSSAYGPNQSAYTSQPFDQLGLGSGYTLGRDVRFAVDGRVTGLRYYRNPDAPTSILFKVWDSGGTTVATTTLVGSNIFEWVSGLLSSPLEVVANQTLRISGDFANGAVCKQQAQGQITNGDLTLLSPSYYATTFGSRPITTASSDYPLDVIFQARNVSSSTGLLSADLSPMVDGFDGKATPDGLIPYSITNTGASSAAITVTLTYIREEG